MDICFSLTKDYSICIYNKFVYTCCIQTESIISGWDFGALRGSGERNQDIREIIVRLSAATKVNKSIIALYFIKASRPKRDETFRGIAYTVMPFRWTDKNLLPNISVFPARIPVQPRCRNHCGSCKCSFVHKYAKKEYSRQYISVDWLC